MLKHLPRGSWKKFLAVQELTQAEPCSSLSQFWRRTGGPLRPFGPGGPPRTNNAPQQAQALLTERFGCFLIFQPTPRWTNALGVLGTLGRLARGSRQALLVRRARRDPPHKVGAGKNFFVRSKIDRPRNKTLGAFVLQGFRTIDFLGGCQS